MNNKIYLLFSCDIHKSWSSMHLIVATTDIERLNEVIINELSDEDMDYYQSRGKEAIEKFLDNQDYKLLDYGYVDIVDDGEVQ